MSPSLLSQISGATPQTGQALQALPPLLVPLPVPLLVLQLVLPLALPLTTTMIMRCLTEWPSVKL